MFNRVFVVLVVFSIIFGIWLGHRDNLAIFDDVRYIADQNPVIENMSAPTTTDISLIEKANDISASNTASTTPPTPVKYSNYIEIVNSCGPHFEGGCVSMRSGPGTSYSTVLALRDGVVLKTSGTVEAEGRIWYKIAFDEWIRYPERLSKNLYVAADYAKLMSVASDVKTNATNTKRIIIDRSEQALYAYDGSELFMKISVSTGLSDMPTPRGNFKIFSKVPSRYMQGPLPGISDQEYDLPGVPWTMYFTAEGAAIHGAYWHDKFGTVWSHGCVNLPISDAEKLYNWTPLGTKVLVQD